MTDKIRIHLVDQPISRPASTVLFLKRLAITFLPPALLIWPGTLTGSTAMQWAGFTLFIVLLGVLAFSLDSKAKTIDEAIAYLEKLKSTEGGTSD
jgi:hypothetical protein